MGESELASKVVGATDGEDRAIGESEGDDRKRFRGKEGR